jgi:hypothetical protein
VAFGVDQNIYLKSIEFLVILNSSLIYSTIQLENRTRSFKQTILIL